MLDMGFEPQIRRIVEDTLADGTLTLLPQGPTGLPYKAADSAVQRNVAQGKPSRKVSSYTVWIVCSCSWTAAQCHMWERALTAGSENLLARSWTCGHGWRM